MLGYWVLGGCACNSRLNLVRLFVNPPHPTRARTPPWGGVPVRPPAPACPPPGCSCACACARPVVYPVPACACLCALPVAWVRAVRLAACPRGGALVCAPGSLGACMFCSGASAGRLRLLLSLLLCWLAPFASGFPLAYAGLLPPSLMPGGSLAAGIAAALPSLYSW